MVSGILALILSFLGPLVPGLAATIGQTFIKAKETQAAREGKQDEAAVSLGHSFLQSVTSANQSRLEARKAEGAWGPLGIITMLSGLGFVFHEWFVVLDSTPWSLLGLLDPHLVGSWGVAKLPGKWEEVELEVFKALFYVAPPAAAAVVVAKAFRR
ncbi:MULTISPECIES: hypothetical protein [unclassified Bradyrhizobium]|uniref:hypothetical protein n=1 Tax=unclassified Bradyrhizobium TaxID=2631580 RepID=UPI0028EFB370|nr:MULTISPECIES: hypothetical protein [unclassified Bradyrhizobium]